MPLYSRKWLKITFQRQSRGRRKGKLSVWKNWRRTWKNLKQLQWMERHKTEWQTASWQCILNEFHKASRAFPAQPSHYVSSSTVSYLTRNNKMVIYLFTSNIKSKVFVWLFFTPEAISVVTLMWARGESDTFILLYSSILQGCSCLWNSFWNYWHLENASWSK